MPHCCGTCRLWHLAGCWRDLVRNQENCKVSVSTSRLEGLAGALWARFNPTPRLTTEAGTLNFVWQMAGGRD